ncbi:MAG TPA: DUF416 family protein [Pyrinomonadaceae bacterium]|nr:DUF416 family protein [Pyrinomonadaceae bacterium]
MNKILVQHHKINSLDRDKLSARKMFAFGVFCAERQFPIYEKLAVGKNWNNTKLFRDVLNKIWDWLLDKDDKPQGYLEICDQAVEAVEQSQVDIDSFAFDASLSFSGLIYMVENDIFEPNSIEGTIHSSLNIIHTFLFDYLLDISSSSPEGELISNSHELIINEIIEQDYCINMILNSNFSIKSIEMLRQRASGQSILGNYL